MKLALVTTPAGTPSGIGDYTRHLLPYLRERAEIELFVEDGCEGDGREEGLAVHPVSNLEPRRFDQTLYQLGNERRHAFMLRMLPALGGTVVLHDWVLFDAAAAAFPALERGGLRGLRAALREGGLAQARLWAAARRGRFDRLDEVPCGPPALVDGWHAPEAGGRWSAPRARLRVPAAAASVEVTLEGVPGTRVTLRGKSLACSFTPTRGQTATTLVLEEPGMGTAELLVRGARRRGRDPRRLGVFVRRVVWRGDEGRGELDLGRAPLLPLRGIAAARFELPFNRSVVRDGDAFVVHSAWMRSRILAERNAPTPIAVVPHGCERRWERFEREDARRSVLPADWSRAFVVVSFGALQRHKRVHRLLEAFAQARETRPELRLLLVGAQVADEVDVAGEIERGGLGGVVQCTGWLEQEEVWRRLAAADLAVNLRGPSTGGASGGAAQALSLGRGVIISDREEHRDLPEQACPRVPVGEGEVETLAKLLAELASDPARRDRMERAARAHVEGTAHWGRVADLYLEALDAFPNARAARRSLVALAFRARTKAAAIQARRSLERDGAGG